MSEGIALLSHNTREKSGMDTKQRQTLKYVRNIQKVRQHIERYVGYLNDRSALSEVKDKNEPPTIISEFLNLKLSCQCLIVGIICLCIGHIPGKIFLLIRGIGICCFFYLLFELFILPIVMFEQSMFILISFFSKIKAQIIQRYLKG